MIKTVLRKIIYGDKFDSRSYIKHLNHIGAKIADSVYFVAPSKTTIDETRPYLIEIDDYVTITQGCTILTHGFDWSVLKIMYGEVIGSAGKVVIEKNCFIGANTTILKGVTIGKNSIIGAGSLVCRSIPENSVAAGNPCKVICSIEEYYQKRRKAEEDEAKMLISAFYKRNHAFPPMEELAEFFWLFWDRSENAVTPPPSIYRKLNYGDNYELSLKMLLKTKPKFKSYEDLCNEAIKNNGM